MNATCPKCDFPVDFDAPACPKCGIVFASTTRAPAPRADAAGSAKRGLAAKPDGDATLPRVLGYVLAALALALTLALSDSTAEPVANGYRIGYSLGGVLVCWLVMAGIAALVTQGRPSTVKGAAVAVVGALVLFGSFVNVSIQLGERKAAMRAAAKELREALAEVNRVTASANSPTAAAPSSGGAAQPRLPAAGSAGPPQEPGMPGMIKALATMLRQSAAEGEVLNGKFRAVDLQDVLTGPSLVSAAGIARSRGKLTLYEALVAERADLFTRLMARGEAIILQARISEEARAGELKAYYAKRDTTSQTFRARDTASRAVIASVRTVLDFAERSLGRLTMRGDKLMFHRQPELDAYRDLMRQVNDDSRVESAAQERLLAAQRSGAQGMGTLVDQVSR